MSDEPSLGELRRRYNELRAVVDDMPGRREYAEFQNYVNHRFSEQATDVVEERHAREEAVKEAKAEAAAAVAGLRAEAESKRNIGRTGFFAMLGTLLAALAVEAVNAWLRAGGHG